MALVPWSLDFQEASLAAPLKVSRQWHVATALAGPSAGVPGSSTAAVFSTFPKGREFVLRWMIGRPWLNVVDGQASCDVCLTMLPNQIDVDKNLIERHEFNDPRISGQGAAMSSYGSDSDNDDAIMRPRPR